MNPLLVDLVSGEELEFKASRNELADKDNVKLFINDGHVFFRNPNSHIEMSKINHSSSENQIYQDKVDE